MCRCVYEMVTEHDHIRNRTERIGLVEMAWRELLCLGDIVGVILDVERELAVCG